METHAKFGNKRKNPEDSRAYSHCNYLIIVIFWRIATSLPSSGTTVPALALNRRCRIDGGSSRFGRCRTEPGVHPDGDEREQFSSSPGSDYGVFEHGVLPRRDFPILVNSHDSICPQEFFRTCAARTVPQIAGNVSFR